MKKILLFIWLATAMSSSLSYDLLAIAPDLITVADQTGTNQNDDEKTPTHECTFQIVKNISPNLQVDFHPDLSFEFELPLILDNTHSYHLFYDKESKEYFKTLFHFIISPNAP